VSKERDVLNRVAGVTEVDYVYEGEVITDTNLSQALVDQINYTLTQDINRPLDRYTLAELELSDESNYDITGLKVVTSQDIETNIFDFAKLTEFLKGVKERMKALNKDFNLIKDIHFKGMIPTGVANYTITKRATSEDVQEDGDFNIVYKTSELASVEKNPTQQLQEQQAAAVTELETKIAENAAIQAKSPRPPVIRLKMRKKRDLRPNTILVFENDPSAADKGARKRIIKEGDIFWGYFLKDWANGKIWAVYEPDKTTFVGYGVADKNDFVDPI
jgi:hypothetical protein